EAVYAMSKHNFELEKFFEIDIKHYLLVRPGVTANKVSKIVSHPQALKQCRMYLKRVWGETELEEYVDTASAAKDLSGGKLSNDCAVIAPKICADLYSLDILDEEIQDLKFNFTTFIAATKENK
ncbi:prephenate dehydratase domain-containing protein, partial [Patescibacteria group bacterium]